MENGYLFIRILEACNFGCFMCNFAHSKDRARLTVEEFTAILQSAKRSGIRYIRFTGGEPLLHRDIFTFLSLIKEAGMHSSIITNGSMLTRYAERLAESGLGQVIVSIDAPTAEQHDQFRDFKGGFDRAIKGLQAVKALGIRLRVNSVCGPHNFRQMPMLQDILTEIGVEQWELSTLKLEKPLDYTEQDRREIDAVIQQVYIDGPKLGKLAPLGKFWCGNTPEEQELYFTSGTAPRPDHVCHMVGKIRYLDAKNKRLFPCSLLPHRLDGRDFSTYFEDLRDLQIDTPLMEEHVEYLQAQGPHICTGCSATAAGCSNAIHNNVPLAEWYY